MSAKYKQYFQQMCEQNQQLFDEFAEIHQQFEAQPIRYRAIFNGIGRQVTEIVRDWDRRLCSAMGRGQFSQYSQNLSEKFWGEVRGLFPLIDQVGVIKKWTLFELLAYNACMDNLQLKDPQQTKEQIVAFLKKTYGRAGKAKAVIAVSGGIDSALALTLLTEALGSANVYPVLLPYQDQDMSDAQEIIVWNKIPKENQRVIPIGEAVDQLQQTLLMKPGDKVRLGNVMARVRMIAIFDLAKKLMNALVCGTENKSEHYLGYFTRYGDGASDLEPILGLYKTQVRELAKELGLPEKFLDKDPSAGLWQGQTDEQELGFSYQDADRILIELIDNKKPIEEIKFKDIDAAIVGKVIARVKGTEFKHQVPYSV